MQCFKIPETILEKLNSICRNFWWGQKGSERKLALVSWKRMCKSKMDGGIGMRDLSVFNKALLAKQCWRLITKPDSLAARVLKGKYFPRTSFWEAKISPNSSYTWRSIVSARELLQRGSRWVVGNGRSVRFWKDSWIPNLPGGRILTPCPIHLDENAYVSDWRDDVQGGWNIQNLSGVLLAEEIEAIQAIPVSETNQEDVLAWTNSKKGVFSVRSAYHLEWQIQTSSASNSNMEAGKGLWKRIRSANVPPKVRNLMWRALSDGLPTMANLARRGIAVDRTCPRCGEEDESTTHVFLKCGDSKVLWRISPLRMEINEEDYNFFDWCSHQAKICTVGNAWEILMTFVWQVWNSRNKWVFEHKKDDLRLLCARTLDYLGEYEEAMKREADQPTMTSTAARTWVPPTNLRSLGN